MRGHQGSRVEAFSDAVFAFALTLLVVSLEVPESVAVLRQVLGGFLAFAATFTIICWIWYQHFVYFRRFGTEDALTIALNCALLFLVLFFVYPLKFTFAGVLRPEGVSVLTAADGRWLLTVYSGGFMAVFVVFTLLYWNAHRQRARLAFDALETLDVRMGVRTHFLSVLVGALALVLALLVPPNRLWVAGLTFMLLGPVHGVNGYLIGRARNRLTRG